MRPTREARDDELVEAMNAHIRSGLNFKPRPFYSGRQLMAIVGVTWKNWLHEGRRDGKLYAPDYVEKARRWTIPEHRAARYFSGIWADQWEDDQQPEVRKVAVYVRGSGDTPAIIYDNSHILHLETEIPTWEPAPEWEDFINQEGSQDLRKTEIRVVRPGDEWYR